MAKTSEPVFGLAAMQVLSTQPKGEATVRTLMKNVPDYVNFTAEDQQQSGPRPNEQMWEQRVRNLKSHDTTPENVIGEGFVEHVGRGRYRLAAAGWSHLRHNRLVQE